MKRNDYKPLGDYIALVNERNRDLTITHLVGVSIEKKFIPSIANIIGTDLSPYKIIRHNQFAYGPVTSRNGEKITIALYKDTEDGILSQAYEVFRIKDEEVLMPEYLMLWVQRPEFDRYARFKSHGSVRELFSWEEMCNVMLPVPPIAEQRKIVEQYQTIERRIKNNEALIQKLEATAQALYHHTFVEGIDKENLPEGWRMGKLGECCLINPDNIRSNHGFLKIKYLDTSSLTNNTFSDFSIFSVDQDEIPSRARRLVKEGDILYSTVRPNLQHYGIIRNVEDNVVVSTGFMVIRSRIEYIPNEYLYLSIIQPEITNFLQSVAEQAKATYPSIKDEDLLSIDLIIPSEKFMNSDIGKYFTYIYKYISTLNMENTYLLSILAILAAKLS